MDKKVDSGAFGFNKLFTAQQTRALSDSITNEVIQGFDRAKHDVVKSKMTLSEASQKRLHDTSPEGKLKEKAIQSTLRAAVMLRDNRLTLTDPTGVSPNTLYTVLGDVSTAISSIIAQMPMSVLQTNPMVTNIASVYENARLAYFQTRSALPGGLAAGARFGAQPQSTNVSSRSYTTMTTGFFGSRITLDAEDLLTYRATDNIDGFYGIEAMARAIGQCALQMQQRKNHLVTRTITDNEYTYYVDDANAAANTVVQYGRLDENVFSPPSGEEWATVTGTGINKYTINPNAKPITWLTQVFSAEIPVLKMMFPHLKGFACNTQTAGILTQLVQAATTTSQLSAIALQQAYNKEGWGINNIVNLSVPALSGKPFFVVDDVIINSVDATFGYVNDVEYYIPDGYIVPIFDYLDNMGNGTMFYTPDPRAKGRLMGSAPLPENILGFSEPEACYMRIMSSSQTPNAESMFWTVEMGARMGFFNQMAMGTSFILKVF